MTTGITRARRLWCRTHWPTEPRSFDASRALRRRFDLPTTDQPFFGRYYREGEVSDGAVFRIFEAEKRVPGLDDEAVLDALVYG